MSENELLPDIFPSLETYKKEYVDHPLMLELEQLQIQYQRLERRLNKITRIGDLMQAQIMELNVELQLRASTDPLTGLLNRAGLYPRLQELESRLSEHDEVFSILILDLDYFKEVNDLYGHLKGDQLLVAVANILQSITSLNDICVRWGGEEFMVLLPGAREREMRSMAERIMHAVRSLRLSGAEERRLTTSIGAYYCSESEEVEDCIRKADLALYSAKSLGRDQLIIYAPELGETRVVL